MPILTIEKAENNKILKKKSSNIKNFHTPEIKILFQQMNFEAQKQGVAGIAAPQIGKNYRAFALHIDKKNAPVFFCNPKILNFSEEIYLAQEGCLSVPGKSCEVKRYKTLTVSWQDINGNKYNQFNQKLVYTFDGFWAHAIQHEMDHLDGILCIDKAEKIWDNQ